jgi:hypothetical protein
MNAVLFDTLKFAHRMKQAGFNEKQAEGAAEAQGAALTGTGVLNYLTTPGTVLRVLKVAGVFK